MPDTMLTTLCGFYLNHSNSRTRWISALLDTHFTDEKINLTQRHNLPPAPTSLEVEAALVAGA